MPEGAIRVEPHLVMPENRPPPNRRVRLVDNPDGSTDATIVTEGP